MRSLAVALTLVVLTPLYGTIVILAGLFRVPYKKGGVYEQMGRGWAGALVQAAGIRIEVDGKERAAETGRIFVCNHTSWFDIFALAAILPNYTFVAKRELARIPLFGTAAKAVGIIFIDRANRRAAFDSYREAAEQVRAGKSVVVYPEGTRGNDYALRPFKKGPFVLAIAAGVPIVPCIVHGQTEILRKGSMRIKSGPVRVHFLEEIETAGYTYEQRDELLRVVWNRMATALEERYGVRSPGGPLSHEAPATAAASSTT